MGNNYFVKISDVAAVFDGPHATPKKIDDGPYFLSISSLEGGMLDLSKSAHLSDEQFIKWTKRVTPQEGDVLFSYETRLGEAALMPAGVKACLGRRMGLLRPYIEKVIPEYLLYAYLSPDFQQEIKKRTIHGATVDRIALKEFPDFNIRIPPLDEQRRVVEVLNSMNGKLTVNRQINQTLEKMAQALFKSWFVDFDPVVDNALDTGFFEQDLDLPDELLCRAEARKAVREHGDFKPLPEDIRQLFPAAFEECPEPSLGLGGWVPKGWQVQSIKDFANVTDYVANGSFAALKENVTLFDAPEYALYIRTTDFKNDFDKEKSKYVDKHAYDFLSKTKLSGSEVIISNVGDIGTVFRPPYWLGMPMTLGSNAIAVSTQCLNDYLYFYFSSRAGQSAIDGIVSGSAQQKFNKTGFRSLRLLLPSNSIVLKFNEVYQGIFLKIISNKQNILYLEQLRDTLLPKLISGELNLADCEALEEAQR